MPINKMILARTRNGSVPLCEKAFGEAKYIASISIEFKIPNTPQMIKPVPKITFFNDNTCLIFVM